MKKGTLITLVSVGFIAIMMVIWGITLSNNEIKLRNRGNAQQEVCQAYFDKVWKILKQKAGVTEKAMDDFKEIYPALMEGRYSGGGEMMMWIQEQNPEFPTSLFKELMASIEGERNGFFIEQAKLIDIDREHKNMREVFPNKMIIGDRPNIGYEEDPETGEVIKKGITIIKSLKTKEAYETGEENDVDLF